MDPPAHSPRSRCCATPTSTSGLARADPLGLGVDVDLDGRLVPYDGGPTPAPYVVGALRRGQWLETTAIPEIRQQAHHLARAIGSHGALPTAA